MDVVRNGDQDPSDDSMAENVLARFRKELLNLKEINSDLATKLKNELDANNKKYKMYDDRVESLKEHLVAQAKLLLIAQKEIATLIYNEQADELSKCLVLEHPQNREIATGLEELTNPEIEMLESNKFDQSIQDLSQSPKPKMSLSTPGSSGIHVNGTTSCPRKPFLCSVSGCHQRSKSKKCEYPGCGLRFGKKYLLERHRLVHASEKPFTCGVEGCGRRFLREPMYRRHLMTHGEDRPFKGCGRTFQLRKSLRRHKLKHTAIKDTDKGMDDRYEEPEGSDKRVARKRFQCGVDGCGLSFAQKSQLCIHVYTHNGEKPFQCDVEDCARAFARKYSWQMHMRTHTGEKPFQCQFPGCDRSFATSAEVRLHSYRHTDEKPLKCEYPGCGAGFVKQYLLERHTKVHTGEKPFSCDFEGCGRRFSREPIYRRHLMSHNEDRPFKCTVAGCEWGFVWKYELRRHMVRHSKRRDN